MVCSCWHTWTSWDERLRSTRNEHAHLRLHAHQAHHAQLREALENHGDTRAPTPCVPVADQVMRGHGHAGPEAHARLPVRAPRGLRVVVHAQDARRLLTELQRAVHRGTRGTQPVKRVRPGACRPAHQERVAYAAPPTRTAHLDEVCGACCPQVGVVHKGHAQTLGVRVLCASMRAAREA